MKISSDDDDDVNIAVCQKSESDSSDEESQVLSNINKFRDMLREYEVKNDYHMKKYTNQEQKVAKTCISKGCYGKTTNSVAPI